MLIMTTLREWIQFTANHCDAWITRIAFFYGDQRSFNSKHGGVLFNKLSSLESMNEPVEVYYILNRIPEGLENAYNIRQRTFRIEGYNKCKKDPCGLCNKLCKENEFWIKCEACNKQFYDNFENVREEVRNNYLCAICTSTENKMSNKNLEIKIETDCKTAKRDEEKCGLCNGEYQVDKFWIQCDGCDKW
eukprot:Gb_29863 [translate_table: standard]